MTKIKFISLASGSSGNCYYVGADQYGFLIDAGISVRSIKKGLTEVGINMNQIKALFITHDHADHIKAAGYLGEKMGIPVYTTQAIHQGMNHNYCMAQKISTSGRYLQKQHPIQIEDFTIEAFEVPHDGTDNVGYYIRTSDKALCFVTDLGEITPLVAEYIQKSNYLVIESNYDEEMLKMGPYPAYLKARIASKNGHLSNTTTANFLAEHTPPQIEYIWLCHLSKDNNHPELAYKTVELKLRDKGIIVGKDVQLCALKRGTPSLLYELE